MGEQRPPIAVGSRWHWPRELNALEPALSCAKVIDVLRSGDQITGVAYHGGRIHADASPATGAGKRCPNPMTLESVPPFLSRRL